MGLIYFLLLLSISMPMKTKIVGVLLIVFLKWCELGAQVYIDGTYDRQYRSFIPHVNLLNHGMNAMYEVDLMVHGYGVIKNREHLCGVIDSTGRLVIPMEYQKLTACRSQKAHFIFYRDQKMGIIGYNGFEQCVMRQKNENDLANQIVESRQEGLFYLLINGKRGLFDMSRSKVIIPAEYDDANFLNEGFEKARRQHAWMYMNDTLAMVRQKDSVFVYDLRSGVRSKAYQDVVLLNNGHLFLKGFDGFAAVSGDFLNPVNALPFRVCDTYNDCIIGKGIRGFGVTTANGDELVPFIYEDILFLNKNALWLKHDGKWAVSDYRHQVKTAFEFLDIEQSNTWFIQQLLEVTRLDTTGGNLFVEREYAGINHCPTEIKKLIYQTELLFGSKRLYNTLLDAKGCTNRSAAKRSDGWHFMYPPLNKVEPEAWEAVRYVPNNVDPSGMMGYCLNGKWGVDTKDVRYAGILYDSLELSFNCDNGCIIKHEYIYSYSINYSINNKGSCYWNKEVLL
jgi:hypothetical protein